MSLTDQRRIRPNRIPFGNAPRLMRFSRVLLPMPNVFMSWVLLIYAPNISLLALDNALLRADGAMPRTFELVVLFMLLLSFLVSSVADWLHAVIEYVVTQAIHTYTCVVCCVSFLPSRQSQNRRRLFLYIYTSRHCIISANIRQH